MWDSVYTRSISICEATTTPSLQEGYVTGRWHHYQFSPGTSRTNPLSTTSSYQRRNVGCHHHRHTTTTLGVYGGTQQSELTFSNVRHSRIQPPTPHPCHKGSMRSPFSRCLNRAIQKRCTSQLNVRCIILEWVMHRFAKVT
jgi:hypothetical protein